MQLLSKAAVVDVYEDEFGEVSWELKPEMVFWKIAASVVDPTCILGAVIVGGIPNKLYVLCRLLLSGWLLSDDIPNEYNLASLPWICIARCSNFSKDCLAWAASSELSNCADSTTNESSVFVVTVTRACGVPPRGGSSLYCGK